MADERADLPAPDADFVTRIARGDEAAFTLAYERYADTLFGSLVRFSGDREVAAEVVQDTFLTLWHKAGQFDPRSGTLLGWLLRIARNRAIDRFRAEARRPRATAVVLGSPPDVAAADTDHATDPTAEADRRWLRSVVRTFVAQLPDEERDVVLLAYAGGLSQSEVSSRTGLPLGTVKSRTRRALAHLRAGLASVPGMIDAVSDR
jgi:RNA polymerase sigma-70 factor (ECF subfamily)